MPLLLANRLLKGGSLKGDPDNDIRAGAGLERFPGVSGILGVRV